MLYNNIHIFLYIVSVVYDMYYVYYYCLFQSLCSIYRIYILPICFISCICREECLYIVRIGDEFSMDVDMMANTVLNTRIAEYERTTTKQIASID